MGCFAKKIKDYSIFDTPDLKIPGMDVLSTIQIIDVIEPKKFRLVIGVI